MLSRGDAMAETLTVEQAARALGIGRGLAYSLVRTGAIPSLRLGERRLVVPRSAIAMMLTGKTNAAVTTTTAAFQEDGGVSTEPPG
jgi:excisionase family DNA binding protein